MRLNKRAREATAYHEAGHAVAAHMLHIKIRKVSIVPEKDSHGRMRHRSPLAGINLDWDDSPKARIMTEKAIEVCLAGPIAQRRYRASSYRTWHGAGDHELAVDLATRICGSGKSTTAFLKWLHIRTEDLLTTFWPLVEATAQELLAKDEIRGADVAGLVPRAIEIKTKRREEAAKKTGEQA